MIYPRTRKGLTFILFCVPLMMISSIARGQLDSSSLTGTVLDPTGTILSGAKITLLDPQTGITFETITTDEGRFGFSSVRPGQYQIRISVSGFETGTYDNISVSAGQSTALTLRLGSPPVVQSSSEPPDRGGGISTSSDPVWNVWPEETSATPNFRPVKLQVNKNYSLVVNLSAFVLRDSAWGIYSQKASSSFARWVLLHPELHSASIDIRIIPDRKHFVAQLPGEEAKSISIDLDKIRQANNQPIQISQNPFEMLRLANGALPFNFGTNVFRIHTRSIAGMGNITLSIWGDGKPIDEVSVNMCLLSKATDTCESLATSEPTTSNSLDGIDLTSTNALPDAAIHIIDRGTSMAGVYRCNTCGWPPYDYRVWEIDQSAQWLADRIKEILDLMTQAPTPKSGVTAEQVFNKAGSNLYNILFDSQDQSSDMLLVRQALADMVLKGRARRMEKKPVPTLFVRLIPSKPDLILTPLGLMTIPLPDHSREFIAYDVNVQSPLEIQNYQRPVDCVSDWVLFVPPEQIKNPGTDDLISASTVAGLQAVSAARAQFAEWIGRFSKACTECVKDQTQFQDWLSSSDQTNGTAIVALSHHGNNSIYLFDTGSPAIQSASITRSFRSPSFAILDACGTSQPGASEFIRQLNNNGVDAIIATSTEVDPAMAGTFLSLFMNQLQCHSKDTGYTINDARWDATQLLVTRGPDGNKYGSRALAFMFAGNTALRACIPAKAAVACTD